MFEVRLERNLLHATKKLRECGVSHSASPCELGHCSGTFTCVLLSLCSLQLSKISGHVVSRGEEVIRGFTLRVREDCGVGSCKLSPQEG